MQRVLSIDTCGEYCSISIQNGQHSVSFHEHRPREHAQILLSEIQKLAQQADVKLNELDLVVYGRGPGSFTGLRIAAGVAQGLAFAANCRVVAVSTLQTLAWQARFESDYLCTAIDARMGEWYCAEFQVSVDGFPELQGVEQVIAPPNWTFPVHKNPICIGNGWFAGLGLPKEWPDDNSVPCFNRMPHASDALALALEMVRRDESVAVAPEHAIPVYLRDDVTWKNKPKVGS